MKSLAEALLPQPPSFTKKKHYDLHQVLGTGTFGKVVRATWHVPPEQVAIAEHGPVAATASSDSSGSLSSLNNASKPPVTPPSTAPLKPTPKIDRHLSVSSSISRRSRSVSPGGVAHRKSSSATAPPPVAKDVALKIIPKKKVKGNEVSVWSEMEVLKGLDHPNIDKFYVSCHSTQASSAVPNNSGSGCTVFNVFAFAPYQYYLYAQKGGSEGEQGKKEPQEQAEAVGYEALVEWAGRFLVSDYD